MPLHSLKRTGYPGPIVRHGGRIEMPKLSISHGIIESQEGNIEGKSEQAKGVEFVIELPLK